MNDMTHPPAADALTSLDSVVVRLSVEVGRTEMTIRDLLRLSEGAVVELDRLAGDPMDILVNNTLIARGEVVVMGDKMGVRFGPVVDPDAT